jgi:hypothetical protein
MKKNGNETWRECAARHAEMWAMTDGVLETFDELVLLDYDEATACWEACFEWDVLPKDDVSTTSNFEGTLT